MGMKDRLFFVVRCGLWMLLLPSFVLAGGAKSRPNILFILADDQGWADLSAPLDPAQPDASCSYFRTPNMNRLAQDGMRFVNGYSPAPLCTPTRRSIQFGMTPARQHATEFIGQFTPDGQKSIAQYIKQVDPAYRCAVFGKWGEVMSGTYGKLENLEINPDVLGYDESDGPLTRNLTGTYFHWMLVGKEQSLRNYTCEADPDPKRTFSVTQHAISFMKQQVEDQTPFYLQVNYYAIHTALQALPETMAKYENAGSPPRQVLPGVAPMLEDLDSGVGQLLQAIEDLGIREDTYVFFSSDNGGEQAHTPLMPKGSELLPPRNAPLRSFKQYLYEGGIRVPFVVRGPRVTGSATCREPVALYDLLPTFYELAGGRDPLPSDVDGVSLCPLLRNPAEATLQRATPGLIFHRPLLKSQSHSAIRQGDYKLVLTWSAPWQVKKTELFNVSEDIGESQNLAAQMPEKAADMTEVLVTYLKSVNAETIR